MTNERDVSRRKFLGAAAGVAGLAAVGSAVPAAIAGTSSSAAGKAVGERLVPPGKLGIQQFSIRDAITRLSIATSKANGVTPTQGYLGGPNFPADRPTSARSSTCRAGSRRRSPTSPASATEAS